MKPGSGIPADDVTSLHELATQKLDAARNRATAQIDDAARAVAKMTETAEQSAILLQEWALTPVSPSEEAIARQKFADAQNLFSHATFPDFLVAAEVAHTAFSAASAAKLAYEAECKDRIDFRKSGLRSETSVLIARAKSLNKSVETLAKEHAPKMFIEACDTLRKAQASDIHANGGYQELDKRLALWRSAVSALEEAAAHARTRQIAYQAAVTYNDALRKAAVQKGWIAAAIVAATALWAGLVLNPKNAAGCACCLGLFAIPFIAFAGVAVHHFAGNKKIIPEKL